MRGPIPVLAIAFAAACPAAAQDLDECLPWSVDSAPVLAARFGLTPEQESWLTAALRAQPRGDVDALALLPGGGGELREALEASFCADGGEGTVALSAAERWGSREPLREWRGSVETGRLGVVLRRRADASGEELRGGAALRGGGWRVLAGDVALRSRLGLLLGSEERTGGTAPASPRDALWRPSTRLDATLPRGVVLERAGGGYVARTGRVLAGTPGTVVEVESRRGAALATGTVIESGGRRAGAIGLRSATATGRWAAEWAHAAAPAWMLAWTRGDGVWRIGGSVGARERGFAPPWDPSGPAPPGGTSTWRAEMTVRPRDGRFVRAGAGRDRDGDRDGWPRGTSVVEVELGERLATGLQATALWRRNSRAALGGDTDPAQSTLRAGLTRARRGWRLLVRVDLREAGGERARLVAVRCGRTRSPEWEISAALVDRSAAAPGIWWYRRRAGGLHGWDELPAGAWLGGWGRVDVGALRLEGSVDTRGRGLDAAMSLALRHGWSTASPSTRIP